MKHITIRDILHATDGDLVVMGDPEEDKQSDILSFELKDVCIDSRKAKAKDLFCPLPGENTDGHKFIASAMKFAAASLTDWAPEQIYPTPEARKEAEERHDVLIRVENAEEAYYKVGAYIRTHYEPTVIGVTGSVGKTTTRQMIAAALSGSREVYETEGNLNSKIGIPIVTSRMLDQPSEVAVLEMGIDRIGEMDIEYSIARPEIAVVTMIGTCHIEYLGSREGIRTEKLKIAGPDTVLFLNGDDPLLSGMRGKTEAKEVLFYGFSENSDYRAEDLQKDGSGYSFTYVHDDTRIPVELTIPGRHNVKNALVAMAICDYLGLDLSSAAEKLKSFKGLRQVFRKTKAGTTVIDDVYNASPDSMKAALHVLSEEKTIGKRYAVLGDMFELGPDELKFHKEVGDTFPEYKVDCLITVGELIKGLEEHAVTVCPELKAVHFETLDEATEYLKENLMPEDIVLLKASHGMHFDQIVKEICELSE